MSGLQEVEELRAAGFEDPEIAQWATKERTGLREVGFTEEEITDWFGERPPNTTKANSALARAVSESIRRAGQGVADIATIYGPIEAALHAASGLIAGFPAYLGAGVGTLIMRGAGLSDEDPKEIAAKFAESVTYQPMTQAGQRTAQALMLPFTLLTEAGEAAGHKVLEKTDSPVAAALTEATIQMLPPPLLVSLGRRMAGKAPTEQTMKDAAAAIAKDAPEAVPAMEAKLRAVYEETGIDPVVVYDHATKDPKVLENLAADNVPVGRIFAQPELERPSARMALREELQAIEAERLTAAEDPMKLSELDQRVAEIRAELGPRVVDETLPAERPGESVQMPPEGWGVPSKEALLAEAQARRGPQPGDFGVPLLTPEQHAQMAEKQAKIHAEVLAKDKQIEEYQAALAQAGLEHPDVRPIMETMAQNELGWAQIGGRHLGGPMGTPNFSTWIPRAEWWRERPDKKMNEAATRAAVQKAIAGQTLKPIEKRAVDHMLAIAQTRASELKRLGEQQWNEAAGAAREQGLEPTTQNVVEVDLVARAAALDEAAVERAALQFENDEAGFLSAIKGIVDERTSAKAAEGREGAPSTQERPRATPAAAEPAAAGEPAREPTGPITGLGDLPREQQPAAIGRAIEERLRATGADEAEARANGAVWEAFFASAGERYNVDPAALLERYMVSIEAGELPSPAAAGILRQEGVTVGPYKPETTVVPKVDQMSIEITPALKDKALKGMPLFQEGEGAPRGQIEFGERGTIISMLENADRSTFMHETGHFFLEVTRDLATGEGAPALARQDWKVLTDWLALEEGAEIPRAAHEKFAQGFEQYLAEGKAPSPALRSIFEQFRDWLLEIYTIVKDAGLSDDVRAVLDRMLSSQAEHPAGPPPAPPATAPPRPPQSPPPSDPQKAVLERISMDPAIPRRYTWEEFYADVKDDLWPIKNLVDELRQGTALGTAEDPYRLARLTRGAFGRATQFLEYSPFEFKTLKNVGKSLKDVLDPVKDDLDGLRAYAVSRRSIELAARDIVTGVPLEEARAVVEQGQKYEAVLKDLQEYQDHVLAYMKDSGIFTEAQITAMREANKDYVPFYRLMEDAEGQGGAGPGLSVRSPIKRIKGSERKIIDPLESIVKNTYLYTALADRNAVGQALVTLAERSGRGEELVQKVKQPVRPIEIMDEEMSRFLEAHGIEAPEDTLTVFRRNSLVPEHDQIVVFRDGKREVYQVPEEVATAFKATDRETAGMLTQILAIPARLLRAGATLSPDFISRNPVRDQFSAYVLSKSGYVPVLDLARGAVSLAKHGAEFQAWLKSGGANSAMLAMDRDYVQTALARHTGQLTFADKAWNIVKNPLEPLRIASELMENATRMGEFKKALEGMSKEEIQAAGYESREVTLDFARLGARTRSLNMITAFWNAQLEGMDRVVRAIKDRPLQTTIAIATSITLPSVLLWWANHDDPRWKEIPNWQRDLFWIVLTKDHIYRIPKPFELGVIFGSSVERILDAFYDDKPDSFKDFSSTMVNTMGLNFMPTIAAPIVGQIVNWNFFTDRPLVSSSMEKLLPEYQYSSYTTQATRALGHIIGAIPGAHDKSAASPMIIDNYIRAWTGTLGVYALQTADIALRKTGILPDPIRPASTLADMPVLRGFMVRYPSGQAQSIQDFYDSYDKATKVVNTIRHLARQGDAEAALREASIDPVEMVRLQGIHQALGQAQRVIQLVDKNPTMPADEKRQLIDTMYYQMMAMAGAGNATLREMKRAIEAASKNRASLDKQFREAGFSEAEIKAWRQKTTPTPSLELVQ